MMNIDAQPVQRFPAYLWNLEAGRFRGPVLIFFDKVVVTDPATRLRNGQEIRIAGGVVVKGDLSTSETDLEG